MTCIFIYIYDMNDIYIYIYHKVEGDLFSDDEASWDPKQ